MPRTRLGRVRGDLPWSWGEPVRSPAFRRRLLQDAAVAGTFQNVNVFFRTVVLLALVLLAGWWTLMLKSKLAANERTLAQRTAELDQARLDLEQRQSQIRELGTKLEERAAEVTRLTNVVAEQKRALETLELANRLLK